MNSFGLAPPLSGKTLGTVTDSFVIAEWRDAGGVSDEPRLIAPRHVHHSDDEAWYVLEGRLRGPGWRQGNGSGFRRAVLVPRGTPHTYWNPGPEAVRYLLIMTPNTFSLIQHIHAIAERTPATLREVFRKHDSELLEG